jgi:hypothetical protein
VRGGNLAKNGVGKHHKKGHVGSAGCYMTTNEETCLMFFLDNRVKIKQVQALLPTLHNNCSTRKELQGKPKIPDRNI